MSKIRIAHLFGDCDNGGASGVADYDNGVWQHVLRVPRVPLEQKMTDHQIGHWCKINNVDVLVCTMWGTFLAGTGRSQSGIKSIKEVCPDIKIIGLVDEPLLVDVAMRFGGDARSMKVSHGYTDAIKDLDAVMCLNESEVPFYSSFNPLTFNVGLPFPHEGYEHLKVDRPQENKGDDIWVGLGVGGCAHTRWERNYLVALEAFKAAKQKLASERPDIHDKVKGILLSWTEKSQPDVITFIKDNYPDVKLQMRTDMQTYAHYLQSCDVAINPNLRDTPGRFVGECMFFGVPVMTSTTPSLSEIAYTTASPFDVKAYANYIVDYVLTMDSPGRYDVEVEENENSLHKFSFENCRDSFKEVLAAIEVPTDWHELEPKEKEETFL